MSYYYFISNVLLVMLSYGTGPLIRHFLERLSVINVNNTPPRQNHPGHKYEIVASILIINYRSAVVLVQVITGYRDLHFILFYYILFLIS